MGLDIRWPIGLMFLLVGALLVIASFNTDPEQLKRSLGININLCWGASLIIFGGLMTLFAWLGGKKNQEKP